MEKASGEPLQNEVFNKHVFQELVEVLQELHSARVTHRSEIDELNRLDTCRQLMLQFLKQDEIISPERCSSHIDALQEYYLEKKEIFTHKTMIHGDLWWDNILVDNGHITIIDWLESSEQDYCRDLAQLKLGTLDGVLNIKESHHFFELLLNAYKERFEDETIVERIRYYLPLLYLEESFYIPFKFFPWEIKYKEDEDIFKKRFTDYYSQSESVFRALTS
jgi:thiamine kinase-like enzyme